MGCGPACRPPEQFGRSKESKPQSLDPKHEAQILLGFRGLEVEALGFRGLEFIKDFKFVAFMSVALGLGSQILLLRAISIV